MPLYPFYVVCGLSFARISASGPIRFEGRPLRSLLRFDRFSARFSAVPLSDFSGLTEPKHSINTKMQVHLLTMY